MSVTTLFTTPALAHGYAGKRFFPTTLTTDDPFVADELSAPTASWFRNGERPAEGETDVSVEFSKRIIDNFGISLEGTWTHLDRRNEQNKSGFQNLETVAKYQFLTSAGHEAILSAGVGVEWGDTGARKVGADPQTTITPALFRQRGRRLARRPRAAETVGGDRPDRLRSADGQPPRRVFGAFGETAAHTMLERAAPPGGSVVRAAPADIRLRFSEPVEPAFFRVTLTTAAGATVPTGPVGIDPGDDRQLVLALVSPLPAGIYRVTWRVVSRDTHTTEGDFTFEVAP